MELRALMVDVDGVIVRSRPGGWAADIKRDLGISADVLQAQFFRPYWSDVVLGRASLHERLGEVLSVHAPHLTSYDITDYWFAQDSDLDDKLLSDLANLREAGVNLHLATVQDHERADYLWNSLRLCDHFDAMHYAAALGCAKPDPAFYRAIEARTGLAPTDLALLDDRLENVDAAHASGWGGVHWRGDAPLFDALASAGVKW